MRLFIQRPATGSRWYFGNFTLGLTVDAHPRFVNVIACLFFVEIGLGWQKKPASYRGEYGRVLGSDDTVVAEIADWSFEEDGSKLLGAMENRPE